MIIKSKHLLTFPTLLPLHLSLSHTHTRTSRLLQGQCVIIRTRVMKKSPTCSCGIAIKNIPHYWVRKLVSQSKIQVPMIYFTIYSLIMDGFIGFKSINRAPYNTISPEHPTPFKRQLFPKNKIQGSLWRDKASLSL